jgi:hypothetical protein
MRATPSLGGLAEPLSVRTRMRHGSADGTLDTYEFRAGSRRAGLTEGGV